MKLSDLLKRSLTAGRRSANVVGDVNAAVAANVGEESGSRVATSRRTTRVVQRDGRTEVFESQTTERRSP